VLIVTLESLPGYEIKYVVGMVFVTPSVHVLGVLSGLSAAPQVYANAFKDRVLDRNEAVDTMIRQLMDQARQRGANAVVGLRIDLAAVFGTAVWVVPVTPEAVSQYDMLARDGHVPAQSRPA
jgi:uncharacterized protein YbjQ (UPF0145 family)